MRIPTDRLQMRFLFPHKKHYPKGTDKAMENNGKKIIYADNAATTAVSPAVLEAMLPNATATRQACMRSARLQKSRLRKHVQK